MIVVGGIYRELCRDPQSEEVFGSGARAAFALSGATTPVRLRSVACAEDADLARAMGIEMDYEERPRPIRFRYDTPISRPTHDFLGGLPAPHLEAEADVVLAFGMLEAKPLVKAQRLVIDPQSPGLTSLGQHMDWSAERLAIVGNQSEILGLAGPPPVPIAEAAERVRVEYEAEVVVAKCGPRGAVLVDELGSTPIPPHPTEDVWPIGSGDVFSALFAWAWGDQERGAREAANIASLGTATWCSRGPLQVVTPEGEIIFPRAEARDVHLHDVRVYLAGPYFNYGERWLVDLMRDGLMDLGAQVFSPFHEVGFGTPEKVAPADLRGLHECNSVLALLDGVDTGTVFEVGYARANDIPVVGFAARPDSSDLTMLIGTDVPIFSGLAQAAYHAMWAGLP